jgi:serine/threonine-protein kinase
VVERRLNGRYELQAVLGQGGTAAVWRAVDRRLGERVVAVKLLRADLAADPAFAERLRREARSIARLNHPGIVTVFDAGSDLVDGTNRPYLVMEYVDGHSVRELLDSGEHFTPERAMQVTAAVLEALDYSHAAGIVHRDVKPANVMLTDSGGVKVMDFGIARLMTGPTVDLTGTSEVIGTARYLSPEQALGRPADGRSDVYSTGCMLYELLTGRPPFTGQSPVAVASKHVYEPVEAPQEIDASVPEPYAAIALRALAKDPAERYQSAAAMRDDIAATLAGPPIPERRRRVPVFALAAAGIAAAVTGAAYLIAAWPAPEAPASQLPGTVPTTTRSAPQQAGNANPAESPASGGDETDAEDGQATPNASPPRTPTGAPSPDPTGPRPEPTAPEGESAPPTPEAEPTQPPEPSTEPSTEPSPEPSESSEPSPEPSEEPSEEPSAEPTEASEPSPPAAPTNEPSPSPSAETLSS